MNHVGTFTCETCEGDIDCRIGFSNRKTQPLSFPCPHCDALIEITLFLNDSPSFKLNGVINDPEKRYGMFDGRNPFIDLHLDFPVWSTTYVPGHTPYLMAIQKMRKDPQEGARESDYLHFQQRLNHLNELHEKSKDLKRTLRLYYGENKKLFVKKAEEFTEEKLERTLAMEDINLALYRLISTTFLPFIDPISTANFTSEISDLVVDIGTKNKQAFDDFMDEIISTNFLANLQRDCLEIYPRILNAEIALRPALFMDFVEEQPDNRISGKISTKDFNEYKDLYKDITEILGKQLSLVAAINNIIHRQNHNKFKPKDGGALSSISKFADKTLSEKFKYLDDCWFKFDDAALNTGARNAIAHYATEYDEKTQIIQYFSEKEGLKQEKPQEMFFLEFMRMLLIAFREMHYLHHVIKSLFYYEFIINKNTRKISFNSKDEKRKHKQ
ncbi:hypothetical protein [Pseudomonas sp. E102]|uniref:hypothetical protein n=1 Tax=Pseudomonas sp. E102 TaxID=181579 RepID=UPI004046164A